MAIAFIAGFVLGGLAGAAFVWSYEIKVMRDLGMRVNSIEKKYLDMLAEQENPVRVAYICDRKFCEKCDNPECNHCFDIRHAKNFEFIADNEYWEKEETPNVHTDDNEQCLPASHE